MFAPSKSRMPEDRLPLEVLVDLRCESQDFDRIVPQTDASFQYDKVQLPVHEFETSCINRMSYSSTSYASGTMSFQSCKPRMGHPMVICITKWFQSFLLHRSDMIDHANPYFLVGLDQGPRTKLYRWGNRPTSAIYVRCSHSFGAFYRCCT
jgi:hypothetical protein